MAANPPQADAVDMEPVLEIWEKLRLPFNKLLDDVVYSVPDSEVQNSDHAECHQRIRQLEALVASKEATIRSEHSKIQAYTGTVKLLRDELHKKGVTPVNQSSHYSRSSRTNVG
ncbi:hypothetical protein AAVH_24852 [Aphelenchoides avenae]|nr:hypothetical protein AAVH_24852 [Aphelenchus avenae]